MSSESLLGNRVSRHRLQEMDKGRPPLQAERSKAIIRYSLIEPIRCSKVFACGQILWCGREIVSLPAASGINADRRKRPVTVGSRSLSRRRLPRSAARHRSRIRAEQVRAPPLGARNWGEEKRGTAPKAAVHCQVTLPPPETAAFSTWWEIICR